MAHYDYKNSVRIAASADPVQLRHWDEASFYITGRRPKVFERGQFTFWRFPDEKVATAARPFIGSN